LPEKPFRPIGRDGFSEYSIAQKKGEKFKMLRTPLVMVACLILITFGVATASEEGDLAKATQNPVADLISLPFQNNTNFDVGPYRLAAGSERSSGLESSP